MLTENQVGTVRQIGVFGDKNVFINQCEFLCHRTYKICSKYYDGFLAVRGSKRDQD